MENTINVKSRFQDLPDKYRLGMVIAEFAIVYALILVSIYQEWPEYRYLRLLFLFPMYHAGAFFGYTGSIMASMAALVLFVPLIPITNQAMQYQSNATTAIIIIVFYILFGVIVGGTVGAARKTSRYVDTLSNVFMRILEEQDARAVMFRASNEAAALTEASGTAILMRLNWDGAASKWALLDENAKGNESETSSGVADDNILSWCAQNNAVFASNSPAYDQRITLGGAASELASIIAMPVSFDETVYGAILLTDKINNQNFSQKDISVAITISETAGGAIHNIVHEKERQEEKFREEQMRELFSRFVSSSVADYVLERPGLLDGSWQEVTVLVSDLRNFTSLSETIPARLLVAQLNEYFTAMVDVIFDNKGTVDKFMGDCVIAYWGAPAPDPAHASNAARAALAMSAALDSLRASWKSRGMPSLSSGIAIHTCSVLMGNVGDDRKKAFTIMGEEVDKAIRMESLTKTLSAKIIMSETAALAAGDSVKSELLCGAPDEFGRLFSLLPEPR